jgi:DNA-3-methyladenine glycosylase II
MASRARTRDSAGPDEFILTIPRPLDFAASLEIFRRSGDDLLDRFDGIWLVRTLRTDAGTVAYAARAEGDIENPALHVIVEDAGARHAIEDSLRSAFLPLDAEFENLSQIDPVVGRLASLHRGLRPVLQADLLGALVRCISAQQVNLKWASTVRSRLAQSFGRRHRVGEHTVYSLESAALAALEVATIRGLQFTNRKAEYLIAAARAIRDGQLEIESLAAMPDDEVITAITAVRGLGHWTAEWILARTLGRPRISAFDLGVRKAVGKAYFGGRMPSADEVREATAHWGAATAIAQGLLLHAQWEGTLAAPAPATKAAAPAPLKRSLARPRRGAGRPALIAAATPRP